MSGHSKWSTIKRQKGAADAKRGQMFTKLANAISIAVRQGGGVGDPANNPRLRILIETAKSYNMPRDNIERAIKRAQSKQESDLEEVTYEGFGPGGFSIIIEAITDNKQRTTPEVKSKVERLGGNMGTPGSVAYQFEQKGLIVVEKNEHSAEDIFLIAADAGAEDIESAGNNMLVYTKRDELSLVKEKLERTPLKVKSSEFTRVPLTNFPINDEETARKALEFTEKIEDMDDVQKIYANYDIPDELARKII